MRNVSDKSCRENQNTFYVQELFFFDNFAFCEIMWKNTAELGRPQKTILRKRIAGWMPKATKTHSEYVTSIAFPQQP
jgi:hypothetical protein